MRGADGARGFPRIKQPNRIVVTRLLMLWTFLVSIYFLWEAWEYRGLYALVSEWQFDRFGHYLPVLTFALLTALFSSPALWLFRRRRRADSEQLADRSGFEAAIVTGSNFRRVLFAFAAGLGLAAVVAALASLTVPTMAPPARAITIGTPESVAPATGPTMLRGQVLYTRTSAFAQDMIVTRRGVRFAPMVAFGSTDPTLRYFVELLPSETPAGRVDTAASTRTGILVPNNLPGSIVRLYRYAGFRVEEPFYVLYASSRTMRWPYFVTAAQLALAALIALLAALFQHRHIRRAASRPTR